MAADGFLFRNVVACLSSADSDKDRRPYHRNCGCALHAKSPNRFSDGAATTGVAGSYCRANTVSYRMKSGNCYKGSSLTLSSSSSSFSATSSSSPCAGVMDSQ
ncbi:unnamed protein product [Linum trigynum]|uniref:Uncharacterized protein n=1 Tax=Linum trigynum TaxID=586398 RepID=A0AAV2GVQ2_9ROSI